MTNHKSIKLLINRSRKPYLTIDKQIELLESRGMNIKNRDYLKYYLERYNYQNFINGYNDYLFKSDERSSNTYKVGITEKEIINIFNFDRSISSLILSNILDIERQFSSYLNYVICQTLITKYNDIYCNIFALDNKGYQDIFSNAFKSVPKDQWDEVVKTINDTLKYNWNNNKNDDLVIKYPNEKEIPLWCICIYWSFGDIRKILYKYLDSFLFNKFFDKLNNSKINKYEFKKIVKMMNKVRNKCCHNNVVYNWSYKNIKLFDLVHWIDVFRNKKNKNSSLLEQIKKKIIKYLENDDFNKEIREIILRKTNYYKYKK